MTIDSNELIRILPAMLQGRRKFAKIADGGNYHVGKVDEWCLSYADVVKGIEDFCEYKKTGHYTLSAPINGNWNVLNAYQYEPQENCDTCKHKDDGWDSEHCDGCCGNHSGFEPQESEE